MVLEQFLTLTVPHERNPKMVPMYTIVALEHIFFIIEDKFDFLLSF